MKVKEIRELFNNLDASFDDGFYEKFEYDMSLFFEEHGYEGNCFDSQKEWEEYKQNANRAVVLWPMN